MTTRLICVNSSSSVIVVYQAPAGRRTATIVASFPEGELFTVIIAEVPEDKINELSSARSSGEFKEIVVANGGRVLSETVL